ncbi:MAG: hypothetical protein KAS66_13310 [Candidatus Omnitrophica bacterium]|nr:hypothetical protein [Candidatus Omnitrophota bacterium]
MSLQDTFKKVTEGAARVAGAVGGIAVGGLEAYGDLRDRAESLGIIDKETVKQEPVVIKEPVASPILGTSNLPAILGIVGLVGAGVVIAKVTR